MMAFEIRFFGEMRNDENAISKLSNFPTRNTDNATSIYRSYRLYEWFYENHFDDGIMNIQQYLFIFFLWSEMKDFARLSEIGLSNIWKETRKEGISFHGWMLVAFAGYILERVLAWVFVSFYVCVNACICDWIR